MKLEDIIRCIGVNPFYVNSNEQVKLLASKFGGVNPYTGGICNAYIYIPWSEEIKTIADKHGDMYPFEDCSVHGGITYGSSEGHAISDWHCPYSKVCTIEEYTSKYIVVGWDTNHYDDNRDKWTYRTVIEENECLAKQILDIINKELGV